MATPQKQEKWEDFAPLYELPSTYRTIENSIVTTTRNIGYFQICQMYAMEKEQLGNREIPRLLELKNVTEKFALERVARNRHAMYFKKLAEDAPSEIKPILYYYSLEQLLNFFMGSLLNFDNVLQNHGISIQYDDDVYRTKVILDERGFFARVVDMYSAFAHNSIFSSLRIRRIESFRLWDFYLNDHPFALTKKVSLTLQELIDAPITNDPPSSDLRAVILIYAGSAFARYKPFLWSRIVAGIDNDLIIHINRAYEIYEFISKKLIIALNSLRYGGNAGALASPSQKAMSEVFNFNRLV